MLAVKTIKNPYWQLQEAKAMFSCVVKAADKKPQIITVRGKKSAVILSYEEYENLSSPKLPLYDFIQASPLRDINLELPERKPEKMREVKL